MHAKTSEADLTTDRTGRGHGTGVTGIIAVSKCSAKFYNYKVFKFLHSLLRLPHRNDAKIAEFYNFCIFWPVIQQISHLFEFRQKAFLPNAL